MKKIIFYSLFALSLLVSVVPAANAEHIPSCGDGYVAVMDGSHIINCTPTTRDTFLAFLEKIFNAFFVLMLAIASFVILYAAFLYITSEGEEEKVKTAKKMILYAVIALVIALLSWGAPKVVVSFLQ